MQVADKEILTSDANTGISFRDSLNSILKAIDTNNSGDTEPTNPNPFMLWVDTSDATYYYVKQRNHDNTSWVTLFRYTVATKIIEAVSNGGVLQHSALVHRTGYETIEGVKTFSSSPIVPVPTISGQAIPMGAIIEKSGSGIGYGTGSGGSVTQLTSKSTAVTLNKPSGQIITASNALAANSSVLFVFNNNLLTAYDTLCLSIGGGVAAASTYRCWVGYTNTDGGIAYINLENRSGSSLSQAVQINFAIIKGANA